MRRSKPLTVTLGPSQSLVDERVHSGAYASASEVLRAGLRALEREEQALDEILRRKIEASLTDPRPNVSAADVSARLEKYHARHKA